MAFLERLSQDRDLLVEKWGDLVLGTYPEETQAVWRKQKNRFANPVGNNIFDSCATLFDLVLAWDDACKIAEALDELVKIRAVQDFKPSQALSFVYLLKKLLRETYVEILKTDGGLEELMAFETRIDNMALIALDLYCKDRQRIFEMRVREVKMAQHNLLRRANMIVDITASGAESS